MGVVIVFLLAVLFVAAVWGREAAQKLFKNGAKVAAILFALVAIVIILLAVNAPSQDPNEIRRGINAAGNSPYHVPLNREYANPGDPLRGVAPVYAPPPATFATPVVTAAPATPSTGYVIPAKVYRPGFGNPKIGVELQPLQPQNGARYNLPPGYGVYVAGVLPNSAAQQAGLQVGDYIAQVDGTWLTDVDMLNRHNVGKRIGDVIVLRVLRGGNQYLVRLALGNP